jgi:kynureninase
MTKRVPAIGQLLGVLARALGPATLRAWPHGMAASLPLLEQAAGALAPLVGAAIVDDVVQTRVSAEIRARVYERAGMLLLRLVFGRDGANRPTELLPDATVAIIARAIAVDMGPYDPLATAQPDTAVADLVNGRIHLDVDVYDALTRDLGGREAALDRLLCTYAIAGIVGAYTRCVAPLRT